MGTRFSARPDHPAYCKMGTGSFLGLKCGRGVLLTTHPPLVPRSWKSRAICVYLLNIYIYIYITLPYIYMNIKWSRYRPGLAQRVGRGIALLFHERGNRRGEWSAARPGRNSPPGKIPYPFYRRLGRIFVYIYIYCFVFSLKMTRKCRNVLLEALNL